MSDDDSEHWADDLRTPVERVAVALAELQRARRNVRRSFVQAQRAFVTWGIEMERLGEAIATMDAAVRKLVESSKGGHQ